MYLESLELLGFKSFASRTILNFHRGVTAIVGPNGCGKSNILDAIRWVLGEQSAKALRGGEMADVIFGGADSRPALGMAEVSMTFADCEKELGIEWNEVRITRRVFRDGNSEYFLNKTPCRLRDIQQLFMDTGIGRSAYSIMEQGKIDLILSSRPEDRRAIFEEAAGITKFKAQRKEALRKLEYTEANLVRLADIIKEVKRQIGSLQRQAGKARRYQALLASLRTLETNFGRHQFEIQQTALDESQAEIARINEAQQSQQTAIDEQEAGIGAERRRLEETDASLAAARQVVQDLKRRIDHAEDRAAFNRERITEFYSLVERCRQDAAAGEEKLAIQETRITDADVELREITSALGFERERLEKKRQAANALTARRAEVERDLQGLLQAISGRERKLDSLRGELAGAVNIRDGSEAKLGLLKGEMEQTAATLEHYKQQEAEVSAQLAESAAALGRGQERLRETESQARAVEEELKECALRMTGEERKLAEKNSRLEVLLQLNAEGEGGGTQAVLKGLNNPGFFKPALGGVLASCMQVEPEFIPAIEAALGENLQAIVLKDTGVAESIIKTLAEKKLGRASLALREFAGGAVHQEIPLPEGAIAWANEKAGCADDFRPLLSRLLAAKFAVGSRKWIGLIISSCAGKIAKRWRRPRGRILPGNLLVPAIRKRINRLAHARRASGGSQQIHELLCRRSAVLRIARRARPREQVHRRFRTHRRQRRAIICRRPPVVAASLLELRRHPQYRGIIFVLIECRLEPCVCLLHVACSHRRADRTLILREACVAHIERLVDRNSALRLSCLQIDSRQRGINIRVAWEGSGSGLQNRQSAALISRRKR